MSVSLASHQTQNLIAAHAGEPTSALASGPFAVGPGTLLLLLILGIVLLAAIGHVLALVWAIVRQALPVLGFLTLGLGVVVMLGTASVTHPGEAPDRPATTTSRPAPHSAAPRPAPRPTARRLPNTPPRPATPSSLAPLGDPAPSHR
jgi:hypothetical protein